MHERNKIEIKLIIRLYLRNDFIKLFIFYKNYKFIYITNIFFTSYRITPIFSVFHISYIKHLYLLQVILCDNLKNITNCKKI